MQVNEKYENRKLKKPWNIERCNEVFDIVKKYRTKKK